MSNLKLINMEDVEVEEVKWLIYPFIPYGKITIIQGDPGECKTTLVLQIIARLTKGESIVNEEANFFASDSATRCLFLSSVSGSSLLIKERTSENPSSNFEKSSG